MRVFIKSSGHNSKRFYSLAIALVLTAFVLIAGCSSGNKNEQSSANANAASAVVAQNANTGNVNTSGDVAQGKGAFKYLYAPVSNPANTQRQSQAQRARVLETVSTMLNVQLAIPVDVTIALTECGVANAFYDPETRQISMCYELLDHFYTVFAPHMKSEVELQRSVYGATVFVFFHELGHALINVLDLPAVGREEDAADQLSTVILTNGGEEGQTAVINGANSFILGEQSGDMQRLPFWDEHSLGPQRFFNLLCWVYGHDPDKYNYLVNQNLPQERAVRCPAEYAQIAKSWYRLLAPYMKNKPPMPQ